MSDPIDAIKDLSSVLAILSSNRGNSINQLNWEAIFSDVPSLRYLIAETDNRIVAFNEAVRILEEIPTGRKVRVLVDFDVLLSFLEQNSDESEQPVEINSFFYSSKLPYGFPAGTYIELRKYLWDRFSIKFEDEDVPSSHLVASKFLGSMIGVAAEGEQPEEPEIMRALDAAACRNNACWDAGTEKLVRLAHVLGDSRCGGWYMEHDQREIEPLIKTLQRKLRYRIDEQGRSQIRGERTDVDKADALNLLNICFNHSDKTSKEHFLLLTTTSVVRMASNSLAKTKLPELHLAVNPQQMAILDYVGLATDKGVSVPRARIIRNLYQKLNNILESNLSQSRNEELIEHLSETERREAKELSAKQFKKSLGELVSSYESLDSNAGAAEASDRYDLLRAQEAVSYQHQARRWGSFEFAFTNYQKALDKVYHLLRENDWGSYEVELLEKTEKVTLKEGQITLRSSSGRGIDTMIARLYPRRGIEKPFYSFQWITVCSDIQLVQCLGELLPTRKWEELNLMESNNPIKIEDPILKDSANWKSGVIVCFAAKQVGLSYPLLRTRGGWDAIQFPALCAELGYSANEAVRSPIHEIRVNTPGYSIICEFVAPEKVGHRRFTIHTLEQNSDLVANLYDWLGVRLGSKADLSKAINNMVVHLAKTST